MRDFAGEQQDFAGKVAGKRTKQVSSVKSVTFSDQTSF